MLSPVWFFQLNDIVEKIDSGDFVGNGKIYKNGRQNIREWQYNKRVVDKLLKVAEVFCGGPTLLTQYFVEHKMSENERENLSSHKKHVEGIMKRWKCFINVPTAPVQSVLQSLYVTFWTR